MLKKRISSQRFREDNEVFGWKMGKDPWEVMTCMALKIAVKSCWKKLAACGEYFWRGSLETEGLLRSMSGRFILFETILYRDRCIMPIIQQPHHIQDVFTQWPEIKTTYTTKTTLNKKYDSNT